MADCFIHASDLHLDQPIGDIGSLTEYEDDISTNLALAARGALEELVNLAITREASFVVLAGDIFHDGSANPAVQLHFHDQLSRLGKEIPEIPVFICHGNHDPLANFRRTGKLPSNVTVFGTENPMVDAAGAAIEYVPLRSGNGFAAVSGLSFSTQEEEENLALRFHALERPDVPHVAVLHAALGDLQGHSSYAPCKESDLKEAPVDYWALGHIHLRRVVDLGPGRYAAYCGNLQGRHFKPSECHPKGALVVPISEHGIGKPEFAPCDKVRFVESVVTVNADQEIEDVIRAARDVAEQVGNAAEDRPVVWSLELEGWHPNPSELEEEFLRMDNTEIDRQEVRDLLNGGGRAFFGCVKVKNPLSVDEVVAAGGFPAELVGAARDETKVDGLVDELVACLPRTVRNQFVDDEAARTEVARLTMQNLRLFVEGNDG